MRQAGILSCAALALVAFGCTADTGEEAGDDAAVVEQPAAVEPAPQPTATSAATVAVDTLEGAGAYLTDAEGRALYLLEGESADESRCYDACAAEWPPFLAENGAPPANAVGLDAEFGTLQRTDGTTQLTYGGHPLYYYHDDVEPGQTTGHDVTDQWGEWYLVTPAGEPLEAGGGESEPSGD